MGYYSEYTMRWLDRRYRRLVENGLYYAHMPLYGIGHPASEALHAIKLARVYQILRTLDRLSFATLLDVGGSEGFVSSLARELFDAEVVTTDISVEACRRAGELFDVDAVAVDSTRLPFPDDSFDVVVCAEVVEHVEFGIELLLELERVARRAVVLTTEELEPDRAVIETYLFKRCGFPHFERNMFHPDDLRLIYGDGIEMRSQFVVGAEPTDAAGVDEVEAWIRRASQPLDALDPNGRGVIVVHCLDEIARRDAPRLSDDDLLERLLHGAPVPAEPLAARAEDAPVSPDLLARCVCPFTRTALAATEGELISVDGTRYAVIGGVPVLRDDSFPDPSADDLRADLERRWPGQDDRIARTFQLRETLLLPLQTDRREWDFAVPEDRRGWMPAPSVDRIGDDRVFEFRASDDDPWIGGPGLGVAADRIGAIELTMRIHNPGFAVDAGVGQIFWLGERDDSLSERSSVLFPVLNDDRPHTYRIELADEPAWTASGRILTVRIDPVNGPCTFELIALRLIGSAG